MRIKEIADAAGVPADSVRHYEKVGLLSPPVRSGNGYRRYTAADLQRLRFIANCRALDMSLQEIRELLEALERPDGDCSDVGRVVGSHLAHVRDRMAGLRALERQLVQLLAACHRGEPLDRCALVQGLSRAGAGSTNRPRGVHTG
jgi:DNA-binding transcriptional MerR regulator